MLATIGGASVAPRASRKPLIHWRNRRSPVRTLLMGGLVIATPLALPVRADAFTERVSVADGGREARSASRTPSISASGRYVAFVSEADDLVPGEGPFWDIFIRDRVARTTVLVSRSDAGGPSNGDSFLPSVSADGRYVAFASRASNLAQGDTDADTDVFVRDVVGGRTELVSAARGGLEPDFASSEPALSADGRHVAFKSFASNLVAGDSNARDDIFVRDLDRGATERVNVSTAGEQATRNSSTPAIDATGRFVAFLSHAPNLVASDTNGPAGVGDPSSQGDVFVRDRLTNETERVSVDSAGGQADGDSFSPSISGNGRFVVFKSFASNLVAHDTNAVSDVFLHDRWTNATERVNLSSSEAQANADAFSGPTSVSDTGRFVAFGSSAGNLVGRPTSGVQAFERDRRRGTTRLMSLGTTWQPAEDGVFGVDMTPDGAQVAFDSFADNLVWRDSNATSDVFVHEATPGSAPTCDGLQATIVGTARDDHIAGTPGPDVIVGRGGRDTISGAGGSDTICGDGGGSDRRTDDDGRDRLDGGEGADVLIGQGGNDTLSGGVGEDTLLGGVGDDVLSGSLGDDRLLGNAGMDTMTGGDDNDRLDGASGPDLLEGQNGQDTMSGGSGPDRLKGGADGDNLMGEYGDDRVTGADGDDSLSGGSGTDLLGGGAGNDRLAGGMADDHLYGDDGDDSLDGGTHILGDLCRQGPGSGTLAHCEN
jgi:Ca2+-binding RTX toxin-like protein